MVYTDFKAYIYGILNLYNDNVYNFIQGMTTKLFEIKQSNNILEMVKIMPKNMIKYMNRFYMISYNYNGNKMWCPIYLMEYKNIENKHILYAIQLEYLPPKYKMNLFSSLLNNQIVKKTIDKNSNTKTPTEEFGLPIESKYLYNILKNNNNMNYALTGFDLKKIEISYLISTKILPEILMSDFKKYNSKNMKDLMINMKKLNANTIEEDILGKLIEEYDKLIDEYEHDSLEYHKKLRNFESNLKLFKD